MAASSTSDLPLSVEEELEEVRREREELRARVNSLELENRELRLSRLRESAERWTAVAEAANLKANLAVAEHNRLKGETDG